MIKQKFFLRKSFYCFDYGIFLCDQKVGVFLVATNLAGFRSFQLQPALGNLSPPLWYFYYDRRTAR